MGEKFFYDWTIGEVWSVIESTFEQLWQQEEVDAGKVNEEFYKLEGTLLD
jgi:5-methylthioribose kinase